MNVFLGISRSRSSLLVPVGGEGFWCVYRKYQVQAGDLLLLYFTVSGIRQLYRIEMVEGAKQKTDCQVRAMQTVTTRLIVNFTTPVTASQLKGHSVLREMGAVRRNFQETVFRVAPEHWAYLQDLILETNPELEATLRA